MPNLENFKKQAKQYLRWHRERYYPVAAILREYLPRFRQLSDGEILAADFRLADAQEVVARVEGYEGWRALRTGAYVAMFDKKQGIEAKFTSVAAHLFVRDIQASANFFTEKLGFTVDFVYGEPPYYGQVSRDNARLALRFVEEPVFAEGVREQDLVLATITLGSAEEIKQVFLGYQAAGVPFHQVLRREPWGAKTFIVKDPDGNLILFAGPAT